MRGPLSVLACQSFALSSLRQASQVHVHTSTGIITWGDDGTLQGDISCRSIPDPRPVTIAISGRVGWWYACRSPFCHESLVRPMLGCDSAPMQSLRV